MHDPSGLSRAAQTALAACLLLTGILGAHAQDPGAVPADPSVVVTDTGAVAGTIGAGVREFKGIPFAAPPVGERRWAPPQALAPWSGVLDATRYRGLCPQAARYGIPEDSTDEDCLYLNVTTPAPGGQVPAGRRPVIVWIHGGAFVGGSSGLYDLSALAKTGDAVVVSMNYRLGVFGFMPHPAFDPDTDGAYGLLDQRAALRWVQRNIAAFGGDPDNVTIAGESAGASSVCMHLMAPEQTQGLFHKAIIQSGGCTHRLRHVDVAAQSVGRRVAEIRGCTGDGVLACLRQQPVADLLAAGTAAAGTDLLAFAPVYGTRSQPLQGDEALATGRFVRVPMIQGGNTQEQRLYVAYELIAGQLTTRDNFAARLAQTYGERSERVAAQYPLDNRVSAASQLGSMQSDFNPSVGLNHCIYLRTAQLAAQYVPVYEYEFADPNPPDVVANPGIAMGAVHSSELPYQFPGFSNTMKRDAAPLTQSQQALAAQMMAYWTSFARTGTPSAVGVPQWTPFADADAVLRLEPYKTGWFDAGQAHRCGFWRSVYPDLLDRTYPQPGH
ncbi:carboxylesterase family protein [uncultured Thiodictyon sp.]|uniref:carboxylesterase/lipase family protein n=1 Tax=uncultured Thiodictyon sp. TaxID=1846217 RepID=UPI0025E6BB8C|nr:carboxylesterase family protein [uncultured Thiodictyon sp.]